MYDTYPFTVFQNLIRIDQQGQVSSWIESEEFKKDVAFFREVAASGSGRSVSELGVQQPGQL